MHKSIRQLFDLLAPYERRRLGLLLFMVLLMGLLNTAGVASLLPFLTILANPDVVQENETLRSFNEMLGFSEPNEFLIFLGIATFILIFFGQIFTALTVYATQRFGMHREFTFGTRLLARYLGQPYAWFLNRNSAELGKSILSEVERVVEGWLIPLVRSVAQGVVVASLILLLLVVQPIAALTMALIVGGSYWLVFWASRRYVSRIGNDRVLANAARFRATQDALRGIKEVKLLGLEEAYVAQFAEPAERNARYRAASNAIYEMPRFLLEAFVFGAMMLLLLGMMVGDRGELDSLLPVIGVFAFAGARLFPAVQRLYSDLSRVRYNQPALNNLHAELLDGDSGPAEALTGKGSGKLKLTDRLELRDAKYRYQGATASALRGLNLKIKANTTVGLVGSTGAGKTTAVDVILGLLELQEGALVVDGQEIGSANRRAWQRSLGYVPQQSFLIDDTVAANIALGVPHDEIDMHAVERSARLAELHDFIANELPRGYQTVIGDSGARLSGGQRQRICIARALYRDPEVLILDEATSALDNLTERAVMDAVQNLSRQKTIIIIAHRLTTVRSCDQIYLLENGKCSAVGTYDDLVQANAHFREMVATSNL